MDEDQDICACLRCGIPIADTARFCDECEKEERWLDLERNRGHQTLADVGMCEADFR